MRYMFDKVFEDLLFEFDEMGFEPTTLCENPQEEVKSFRNRLQQALLELQAIKEAKPSEVFEDLKELHELAYGDDETSWKIDEIRMSSHIKQALIQVEQDKKKVRAFDVIKEKQVDTEFLIKICGFDLALYNGLTIDENKLTQEEFELLKEVM